MSCSCPKLESLFILSYIQEVIYFAKKSNAPYQHSARSQGRAQSIWPESEHSDENRQAELHPSSVIAGDNACNPRWGNTEDNLGYARAIQTAFPKDGSVSHTCPRVIFGP